MSQDHYVWLGPPGPEDKGRFLLRDKAVVYDPVTMHLEPMRGSGYTLAVFPLAAWVAYINGGDKPQTIGYCTVGSLDRPNWSTLGTCQSVKEWMVATDYKWEGPK